MVTEMSFDSVRSCDVGEELDIDVAALDRRGEKSVGEWQRVCVEFDQAKNTCQVILTGGDARRLRDLLIETLGDEEAT